MPAADSTWLAHEEQFLARLAVNKHLMSDDDLRIARLRQDQYRAQGVPATLPQVLIKMQLLSKGQVKELIDERKRDFVLCTACGHAYPRRDLAPGATFDCSECGVPVQAPEAPYKPAETVSGDPPFHLSREVSTDGVSDDLAFPGSPPSDPGASGSDRFELARMQKLEGTVECDAPRPPELEATVEVDAPRPPAAAELDSTVECDAPQPEDYEHDSEIIVGSDSDILGSDSDIDSYSDPIDALEVTEANDEGYVPFDRNEAPTINIPPDGQAVNERPGPPGYSGAPTVIESPSAVHAAIQLADRGAGGFGIDEAPTINMAPEENPFGGPRGSGHPLGAPPSPLLGPKPPGGHHATLELGPADLANAGLYGETGSGSGRQPQAPHPGATPSGGDAIDVSDLYQEGRIGSGSRARPGVGSGSEPLIDDEATVVTGPGSAYGLSGPPGRHDPASAFGGSGPFGAPPVRRSPSSGGADPFGMPPSGSHPFAAPPSGPFSAAPSGPFPPPPSGAHPFAPGSGAFAGTASDPFGMGPVPGASSGFPRPATAPGSSPFGPPSDPFGSAPGGGGGFHGAPTVLADDPLKAFGAPASAPPRSSPPRDDPFGLGGGGERDGAGRGTARESDEEDAFGRRPSERRRRKKSRAPLLLGVTAAIATGALVFLGYQWLQQRAIADYKQALARIEGSLQRAVELAPSGSADIKGSLDDADALLEDPALQSYPFLEADVHHTLGLLNRHVGEYHASVDQFARAIEAAEATLDVEPPSYLTDPRAYLDGADTRADHLPARYDRAFVRAWFLADRSGARSDIDRILDSAPSSPYGPAGNALLLLLDGKHAEADRELVDAEALAAALAGQRPVVAPEPAPPPAEGEQPAPPPPAEPSGIRVLAFASTAEGEVAFLRGLQRLRATQAESDAKEAKALAAEAVDALGRALAAQPNDFLAYALRAEAHLALSDSKSAREDAGRAISINPADAHGYIARGRVHLAVREPRLALDDFRMAVDKDRNNVDALVWRATALRQLNNTNRALKDLSRALELERDHRGALWLRANLHYDTENYRRAVDDLGRLLSLDSNDRRARRLLADCNRARKMWKAAFDEYDKILGESSEDLSGLIARSECLVELGKYREAIKDLDGVIAAQSPGFEDGRAHYLLARAYLGINDNAQARDAAQKAIGVNRGIAEYWQAKGRAHLALREGRQALADLERARSLRASLPDINRQIEQARRLVPRPTPQPGGQPQPGAQPQPGGAQPQPQPRPPGRPQPPPPIQVTEEEHQVTARVRDLQRTRRTGEAVSVLEGALRKTPDSLVYNLMLGSLYLVEKDFTKALPVLNKAVSLSPNRSDALALRGQLHLETGRVIDARKDLESALRINPLDKRALQHLGMIALRSGDARAAEAFFRRCTQLQPVTWETIWWHGQALQALGRHADAVNAFDAAVAALEQARQVNPILLCQRGLSLIFLDRLDDAARDAERALRVAAQMPFPYMVQAEVAAARGNKEEALRQFTDSWNRGMRDINFIRRSKTYGLLKDDPRFQKMVPN